MPLTDFEHCDHSLKWPYCSRPYHLPHFSTFFHIFAHFSTFFHIFPHFSQNPSPVFPHPECDFSPCMSCRLCLDAEGRELLSPCACRGSLAHVHADCLLEWCDHVSNYQRCDVCHQFLGACWCRGRCPGSRWHLQNLQTGRKAKTIIAIDWSSEEEEEGTYLGLFPHNLMAAIMMNQWVLGCQIFRDAAFCGVCRISYHLPGPLWVLPLCWPHGTASAAQNAWRRRIQRCWKPLIRWHKHWPEKAGKKFRSGS